jgi:hypothetical protein
VVVRRLGEAEYFVNAVDIPAALALVGKLVGLVAAVDTSSVGVALPVLEGSWQLQYPQTFRNLDRTACLQEQWFHNVCKHGWWIVPLSFPFHSWLKMVIERV